MLGVCRNLLQNEFVAPFSLCRQWSFRRYDGDSILYLQNLIMLITKVG
jgi:hypothetical protein